MGGDGGSIPRRVELVRSKKKKENVGKVAVDAAKWKHCALSQQPLHQPIVACQLGRLYNKEAIIEKLLDESKYTSSVANHIKKLRDVCDLKLTPTPKELQSHELSSGIIENSAECFCCPILGQEMNGSYPFVFSWECGCVVSKRAYDAVKDSSCLNCGAPLKPNSIILLNPESEEELKIAQDRLKVFKESCKKTKSGHPKSTFKQEPLLRNKKNSIEIGGKRSSPLANLASSAPKKVKTELMRDEEGDKKIIPPAYTSVQDDPNASSAFKSLFTTSEEARRQPKAHWVTFNPLYFR
ncbi:Replication termination factor 2 [Taenia crassiceps]|uniref:Replication termination factor 2 n=1 Tax=Taenia crassiceps TaxID=6207 RepID=A0ABR4QMG9_9CEST